MTKLRTFRIDGWRLHKGESEFLVKVEDDKEKLVGTFDMAGDGIYFYLPGSQIITPNENESTRETYDGYMSFEVLKDIFNKLSEIGWERDKHQISVKKRADEIILGIYEDEE